MSLAQSPAARTDFSMAFDSNRGVVVLFGGVSQDGGQLNDVWEYDGGAGWVDRATPPSGPGYRYTSMVHDASRAVSIVYGGVDNGNSSVFLRQALLWNGSSWATPPNENGAIGFGPGRRIQFPMFYDSVRQRSILMYGTGGENTAMDSNGPLCGGASNNCRDIWQLSSAGWTNVGVVGTLYPSSTLYPSVVHDARRDRYVLWRPESDTVTETWLFDPTSRGWARLTGQPVSSNRQKSLLVYDSRRERVLLIGGAAWNETSLPAEVWALRSMSSDWALENAANRAAGLDPEARTLPRVVYDDRHGRVVMFGGQGVASGTIGTWYRTTWVYGGP